MLQYYKIFIIKGYGMICMICGKSVGSRCGGHFNKHINSEHDLKDYEEYVLYTIYNNERPLCKCGCGQFTTFRNNHYLDYYHGHNTSHFYKINRDHEKENIIRDQYVSGVSVTTISTNMGLDRSVVYRILNEMGVTKSISHSKQKYVINETVFEEIDTEEKAYWFGFLYADGYINTDRKSVSLCLANLDYDTLEKFQSFLETNKPIRRNNDNSSKIVIENLKISNDLERNGLLQNKTHKLTYPNIDPSLDKHFIRGYFDGDGSVSYGYDINKPCGVSITSTKDFLDEINKRIDTHFTYNKRHKDRDDNIYSIVTGGIGNILKIYDYFYNGSEIYMSRKHTKFTKWLDNYLSKTKLQERTKELKHKLYEKINIFD